MDVGGGSGELIGAVAKEYPHIRATVFDLPRCEETANIHLKRMGVSDRASFLAGNFFETIPAIADAIVLKSVIHDWDDARSSSILHNCHQALPVEGKLILVERIMPEFVEGKDYLDKQEVEALIESCSVRVSGKVSC
jgi:hypothetical protein